VVKPETLQWMVSPHRQGVFDHTFKRVVDWGLGFLLNTHGYEEGFAYSFGPHASRAAFGHGGHQSALSFADPAHGLVVAAVFNGMPGERRHARRNAEFTEAVYRDLGLADNEPVDSGEGRLT
jgi:CubicO group peptidase (beta-lactamase class C family)